MVGNKISQVSLILPARNQGWDERERRGSSSAGCMRIPRAGCIRLPGTHTSLEEPHPDVDSDAAGLGWGLQLCISKNLLGADTAGSHFG